MAQSLRVSVVGDVSGYSAALAQASSATGRFGSSIAAAGKSMTSAGRTMTRSMTLPIVGIGVASVKMADEFETSMSRIVGLAGVSQRQTEEWGQALIRLGPQVGKSPRELAEALYFVASSGVSTAKAMDVVTVAAKASAAGLGDTQTVADAVTSVMNAYGESNMSAAQATDTLVAMVREGKGEASDFAPVIGNVVAVASKLGVSFNDVGAALAAMTRLGTDAATAGTQLQAFFSSLVKVTPQSAKALAAVGLSAEGLRSELREKGLLSVLQTLDSRFHGNIAAMAKVFPNIRALRAELGLTGQSGETTAAIFRRMGDTTGSLATAFDAARKRSGFTFDKLKATAEAAGISLGIVLMPAVQKVVEWLTRLATSFQQLPDSTKETIATLAAVAAAIGPVLLIFGKLTAAVGGLVRAVAFIATPFGAMVAIIGGLVAAIAAAVLAPKQFQAALERLGMSSQSARGMVLALQGAFQTIKGIVMGVVQVFAGLPSSVQRFAAMGGIMVAALIPVAGAIRGVIQAVGLLKGAFAGIAAGGPMGIALAGLGIGLGILATRFMSAQIAAANMKAAFEAVQAAAGKLTGSIQTLSESNLAVAQAKANVVATSHQVEAALRAETQASDGSAKVTLNEKLAHDNVVQSKLAHKAAIDTYNRALEDQNTAQTKANTTIANAVQPIINFGNAVGKATGLQKELHGEANLSPSIFQKVQTAVTGTTTAQTRATAVAKEWGAGMVAAGQQAVQTAQNAEKMSPAGRASAQAMGMMQEAAGRFAQRTGTLPRQISQITAEAKKIHPGTFEATMQAMVKAAQKAGVEIPGWIRKAAAPTRTAATAVGTSAKAPVETIPGAYSAAGSSAGANLASGIRAQIPSIAAAAAAARNAAKAPIEKFGSTPGQWGEEQGSALAKGIARGIVSEQGVVEGAAKQHAQRVKALMQAQNIIGDIQQAGKTLGYEHAKAIALGVVAGSPTIRQQIRTAMNEAIAEQKQKLLELKQAVVDSTAGFRTAFESLATGALQAFDAKMSAWKPPSQRILDKMNLAEQLKGASDAVAAAWATVEGKGAEAAAEHGAAIGTAFTGAINAATAKISAAPTLAALDRVSLEAQRSMTAKIIAAAQPATAAAKTAVEQAAAALATAQAGGDPEAIKAAQQALDTAIANQKALEAAIHSEIETATGQLIIAEQKRHDQLAAKQREGLAKQLVELETELAKHPEKWRTLGTRVQTLLTSFNVRLVTAGHAWASKFGDGIIDGIPEAVAAARQMAAAVAAELPSTSSPLKPAKSGPLAFHPRDMGEAWMQNMAAGLASGGSRIRVPVDMGMPSPAFGARPAPAAAGLTIEFHGAFYGGTPEQIAQDIADPVYRELLRRNGRNASLGFK
jgi:TP901 family phage tail tape measure protein